MDGEKLLERTSKDLRSVLISAPRGVPLRMLLNDFRMVVGSELPYRQLGYQRLEDFMRSIPNVVRVDRGAMGDPTCFAVADAATSQIARFVATQRKPKMKKSNAPPLVRKPMYAGFTKKSKFGPTSSRPYSSRGRFASSGNAYTGASLSNLNSFLTRGGSPHHMGFPPPRQYRQPYGAYTKGELDC